MKKDLSGSVAIITGAAGGIGSEIAVLFDSKGISCALCDVNQDGLKETAGRLSRKPLLLRCDITDRAHVKKAVEETIRKFGRLDILVNNAGIICPSLFEDSSYDDIDRQVMINQMGAINFCREAVGPLKKAGGGYIITVSSLAGIVPETRSALYSATKFALRGLSLTLNIELKKHHIFTGAVFPDSIDTPMLKYEAAHGGSPLTFLSKPQKPEAVAKAVYRAIIKRKVETYVPGFSATLPKLLMCLPSVIPPLWRMLEKSGEKKKAAYLKKQSGRDLS
ncbi:MAG TPA: SDR family oxidoreductase [Spirochaetota bacterium]|nr:SDR family oxidoreductase [Spirochaetota bacterium]HPI88947.1 SDR family oxidoreductase [Spirochaetota bacterium]HPR46576.1 SDR family oxidoreductase [Spirochaetota bacterium]